MDALAEVYLDYSSYNYVLNNPIFYVDPDGNTVYDKNGKKADISVEEDGNKITINNVAELDGGLVDILLSTAFESDVGFETIAELNEEGNDYQIVNSDKMGMVEYEGQYGIVEGLTVDNVGGYDSRIFLFNTTSQFDGNFSNKDQFDLVNAEGALVTDAEKQGLQNFDKDHFYAQENHSNTQKAINGLSAENNKIFKRIIATASYNKKFGYITTLIHEFVHAKGIINEKTAYKNEIKSFKQSGR